MPESASLNKVIAPFRTSGTRSVFARVFCWALLIFAPELYAEVLFNDQGYRINQMRSPTPETIQEARVIDTQALVNKLNRGVDLRLVDVYPLLWRGIFVQTEPHLNLPGSAWLPNVGQGVLEPAWQAYLEREIARLTANRPDTELVVYCRADCWYSWNAAVRIARMGYTRVYWYPLGIDGWTEIGRVLEPAQPIPFEPSQNN